MDEISRFLKDEADNFQSAVTTTEQLTYTGSFDPHLQPIVTLREGKAEKPLGMSAYAKQISPTGYDWGFYGAGPIALAHSLLAHQFGIPIADEYAWEFAKDIINHLHSDQPHLSGKQWEMSRAEVEDWREHTKGTLPGDDWKESYTDYLVEKYK